MISEGSSCEVLDGVETTRVFLDEVAEKAFFSLSFPLGLDVG